MPIPDRPWPSAGLYPCSVDGCETVAVVGGKCEKHAAQRPATAHRDRVGTPSGHGQFGIVTRTWDKVQCHECGRCFKRLELHLIQTHEMTVEDYRRIHGLLRRQSLLSIGLEERFREKALERVGGEDWVRFERRRAETLPESQKVATRASRERPLLPSSAPGRPRTVIEWRCLFCGTRFPVAGSRSKTTCSESCHDAIRHLSRQAKADLLDLRAREAGWGSFRDMLDSELSDSEISRLTGASRKAVTRRREKARA